MRSWNQAVLSNECKVSCSRKQRLAPKGVWTHAASILKLIFSKLKLSFVFSIHFYVGSRSNFLQIVSLHIWGHHVGVKIRNIFSKREKKKKKKIKGQQIYRLFDDEFFDYIVSSLGWVELPIWHVIWFRRRSKKDSLTFIEKSPWSIWWLVT
jgi:hypothetical protein